MRKQVGRAVLCAFPEGARLEGSVGSVQGRPRGAPPARRGPNLCSQAADRGHQSAGHAPDLMWQTACFPSWGSRPVTCLANTKVELTYASVRLKPRLRRLVASVGLLARAAVSCKKLHTQGLKDMSEKSSQTPSPADSLWNGTVQSPGKGTGFLEQQTVT